MGLYCHVSAQGNRSLASAALDKFVGTWVYSKNGKEVKIILNKVPVQVPHKDYTIDVIEGYHIYKANNKTIENSIESNVPSFILGNIEEREKPNKLKISYFDIVKKKSCDAILVILPGDTSKMLLTLQNKEGLRLHRPGEPEFDKTFTLPEIMILYKQ